MIELNFRTINDQMFHKGMAKLVNFTGFNPKQAYMISRIADQVGTHLKDARMSYNALISKYAQKDAEGKVVVAKAPPFFEMKEGADLVAFNKEYEEFLDIKVTIEKWNKLPLSALPSTVALSAEEIKAIEPLLDCNEDETPSNVTQLRQ
jgi:hypothetical protein